MKTLALMLGAAILIVPTVSQATQAKLAMFGNLPDEWPVPAVVLTNTPGVTASIIAYGASLHSLILPNGTPADIALGIGQPTMPVEAAIFRRTGGMTYRLNTGKIR
jgi:aldose 1-epimerase